MTNTETGRVLETGKFLPGEHQWKWGDRALEAVPEGTPGVMRALKQFAAENAVEEVSIGTLANWRRVSLVWPPEKRVDGVSFTTHQLLMGHPELIEPGMSFKDAQYLLRRRSGISTPSKRGAEGKLETAIKVLQDGSLVDRAKDEISVRSAITILNGLLYTWTTHNCERSHCTPADRFSHELSVLVRPARKVRPATRQQLAQAYASLAARAAECREELLRSGGGTA